MRSASIDRRRLLGLSAGLGLAAAAAIAVIVVPGQAQTSTPRVNVLSGKNIAVHGYDVVSYFVEGKPMRGRAEFSVESNGARWLFATAEHKILFEQAPDKYLPAFGGYCAYGVSRGYLVKIDPDSWTIDNGKLYLNYDKSVRDIWLKDVGGYIVKADAQFPKLVGNDSP